MTILTQAETDAEFQKVAPVSQVTAGTEPFPYLLLSADDFERLACGLLQVSAPPGQTKDWERASLMIRGADAGRDVVLLRQEEVISVVQCKRLEQAMALPAVFRELAKLVLYPGINPSLPKITPGIRYVLVVAREPAGTVIDFFDRPKDLLPEKVGLIAAAVDEVLETYKSLAATPAQAEEAKAHVISVLPTLEYSLIRPHELDTWLHVQPQVSSLFFRQRLVTDNTLLGQSTAEILAEVRKVLAQTAGVGLLTDEDLKIIKERIEQTPPSHRANFGFAATFGYPREMFSGDAGLKARVGRLAVLLQEMNGDYSDWLFARGNTFADDICESPEGMYSHPYARQVPRAFFGYVLRDLLQEKLSGDVMGQIIAKLSGQGRYPDDEARLAAVRQELLAQGQRYVVGDFSQLAGAPELVALKRQVIQGLMQGLSSDQQLEQALDVGIAAMKPKLFGGASSLRQLCAYKPSIFIMGVDAIDQPAVVKLMAETVRGLESLKTAAKA
ncbi:hypothetical protein [Acidisphaera sp. L21]|uniref:hypothetical protein n=1 Tax=Acidisphaera sp. L21 TaxID=1641851 RepID=UPI00131B5FDB|nr:hypothetical protein [Acidisphaera sp. L21]